MKRVTTFLVASLLCAQDGKKPLVIHAVYLCNGERLEVTGCNRFDQTDNSKCQAAHPDRPLHNGLIVYTTETRGDLTKQIQSCELKQMPMAAPTPAPRGPAAPSPPAAPAAAVPAAPKRYDPSVAKARGAGVDVTVFGIPLGETLTLPVCQEVGFLGNLLPSTSPVPCKGSTSRIQLSDQMTPEVGPVIRLPHDKCPDWLGYDCGAIAHVRDGILQGIFAVTHRGQDERGLIAQLREKYGKPTSTRVVHLQNGYGAKIDLEEMDWVLPGLHVAFNPLEGGPATLTGSVRVETETGRQARLAERKKIEAGKPKL